MFNRPLVLIAIAYAIILIILRPLIPVPPQAPYPQEKNEIPIVSALNERFMGVIQKTTPAPYDALLGSIVFGTSVSPLDPELKEKIEKYLENFINLFKDGNHLTTSQDIQEANQIIDAVWQVYGNFPLSV